VYHSHEKISVLFMLTSPVFRWRPPKHILHRPEEKNLKIRKKYNILAEGENLPAVLRTFQEMKFPRSIIVALNKKGIKRPSPIQMQGLPAV